MQTSQILLSVSTTSLNWVTGSDSCATFSTRMPVCLLEGIVEGGAQGLRRRATDVGDRDLLGRARAFDPDGRQRDACRGRAGGLQKPASRHRLDRSTSLFSVLHRSIRQVGRRAGVALDHLHTDSQRSTRPSQQAGLVLVPAHGDVLADRDRRQAGLPAHRHQAAAGKPDQQAWFPSRRRCFPRPGPTRRPSSPLQKRSSRAGSPARLASPAGAAHPAGSGSTPSAVRMRRRRLIRPCIRFDTPMNSATKVLAGRS